ncbi:MAG: hypothetical protein JXB47_16545 [Anaerolineae bacterium]|nr:hypothetical protein [Anaerolineae bacterium]
MNFLRRFFGMGEGQGGRQVHDPNGIYFYVRSHRCDEVIQVRLDRRNDLSQADFETPGYYARKLIVGTKCFDRMEAEFWFDQNRQLVEKKVTGGEFVEHEDYLAYQEGASA